MWRVSRWKTVRNPGQSHPDREYSRHVPAILPAAARSPFEIQATEISVEGDSAADYPLQKKRHSTLIPPVVIVLVMQRAFVRGLVDSDFI